MLTNPIWVVKTRVFASSKNSEAGKAYRGLWRKFLSPSFSFTVSLWLTSCMTWQTDFARSTARKVSEDYTEDPS